MITNSKDHSMVEIIKKQINFDYLTNTELLEKLKKAQPLHEKALFLYSHIINVNMIWLNRIKAEEISVELFKERSLSECEIVLHEMKSKWNNYLNTITGDELHRQIPFLFPFDKSRRTISLIDGIFHIVHHSSYHRGQIVLLLKGSVENLPNLGYVFFFSKVV